MDLSDTPRPGDTAGTFHDFMTEALKDMGPITFTDEQVGTDSEGRRILKPTLSDEMRGRLFAGLGDPEDEDEPPTEPVVSPMKLGAYVTVSHEVLMDFTDHVCTADCPPPTVYPPIPFRRRARYAVRRAARRVTGLRVVHKDRICAGHDE
jgi:hypothetical protein